MNVVSEKQDVYWFGVGSSESITRIHFPWGMPAVHRPDVFKVYFLISFYLNKIIC